MSMVAQSLLGRLGGETSRFTGNEPLVLAGPSRVHVVEEGSVAVFAAEVENGVPVGPRRFLFRVGRGLPLLTVPAPPRRGLRFLAVPIGDARLRELPLTVVAGALAREGAGATALIEPWITHAAALLGDDAQPALVEKVSGRGERTLDDGQVLRPESNTVAWIEVTKGRLCCMGSAEMALAAESGPVPLSAAVWAAADGPTTVRTSDTAAFHDAPALEAALTRLGDLVLEHLRRVIEEEEQRERQRLRERGRRQADLTSAALSELASVMDPRRDPIPHETPLMTAVAAVAEALGFEVAPPPHSEKLSRVADPVEAIARASRIRIRRVLLAGEWWSQDCGPLVAYSDDEEHRPLALLLGKRQRYEIFDPVERTRTRVDRESAERLAPEAVMLYRPLPAGPLRLLDLLRFAMVGRRADLIFILGTGVAATVLGMLTAPATAVLMDQAIPEANRRLLLELGLALAAAAFGQTIFAIAQGLVSMRIGLATEAASQGAVWDRLLSLRPSFFRGFSSGDLQSRALAANDVGRELNGATLRTLFSSFLALLNLGLLLYYSASLALIAVAVTFVALLVTAGCGAAIRKKIQVLQELRGTFYGLVIQLINGVSKLRVAGAERRAYTAWVNGYRQQLRVMFDAQRLEDYVIVWNSVLPTIGTISLFWFGYGKLLSSGGGEALSIGTFLAFNAAFGTFLGGATDLSNTMVGVLDTITKGKRIQPILDAEPEIDTTKTDPGRLVGRVDLERVGFRYRDDGPLILDDVSLSAEPGEFVALVGPSGSGKSTILRLLLGFEAPASGSVLFDGQDLSGLDVVAVRRQLGVVLQSGRLNTGSIFDNIASGSVVSLDEAMEAAADAGFAEDLEQMPMGLHTIVSEGGGNLSGGQRQRLLIARALVLKPRILLFDEATSALDNRTQSVVSESLVRRRVTRLVIAHRLSTVRNANAIYVLDEGRVVEHGTYAELTAREGLFSRMMARQIV